MQKRRATIDVIIPKKIVSPQNSIKSATKKSAVLGKNTLLEIEPMEKFCKRENIFFTD